MSKYTLAEIDLKIRLADYLILNSDGTETFAAEVPFADASRRADFVSINGKMTAFEIKSDIDKTHTLLDQIVDYRKCFDEVYTVTTKAHIKTVLKRIPKSVGVILIEPTTTIVYRKASPSKSLCKSMLVSSLSRTYLLALLKSKELIKPRHRKMEIYRLRAEVANKVERSEIKATLTSYLKTKYGPSHSYFMAHRGQATHSEDFLHFSLTPNLL